MSVPKAFASKGKLTAKAESKTLVKANPNRIALYVSNPSAKIMWLGFGSAAAKEEGILLQKESTLPFPITEYTGEVTVFANEEGLVTYVEV